MDESLSRVYLDWEEWNQDERGEVDEMDSVSSWLDTAERFHESFELSLELRPQEETFLPSETMESFSQPFSNIDCDYDALNRHIDTRAPEIRNMACMYVSEINYPWNNTTSFPNQYMTAMSLASVRSEQVLNSESSHNGGLSNGEPGRLNGQQQQEAMISAHNLIRWNVEDADTESVNQDTVRMKLCAYFDQKDSAMRQLMEPSSEGEFKLTKMNASTFMGKKDTLTFYSGEQAPEEAILETLATLGEPKLCNARGRYEHGEHSGELFRTNGQLLNKDFVFSDKTNKQLLKLPNEDDHEYGTEYSKWVKEWNKKRPGNPVNEGEGFGKEYADQIVRAVMACGVSVGITFVDKVLPYSLTRKVYTNGHAGPLMFLVTVGSEKKSGRQVPFVAAIKGA
jgi:hypothetical protein